ncbi:PAAR domain-containing protein [Pseudomonas nitroreducens]|uniref:PAAR domain-containing protein n=1 Tax=Pseudomonas nitroreducens TaxID=46680 RepID=A0A246FAK1_PSENT|nr:PAAR domain-containing protein [Pseudomonas nitroreducens]OWP49782.1 hypothetical protein CEG18_15180 [Pseudomonas nitroreducens]
MRGLIREGDRLSSGGEVLSATAGMKFLGRNVACKGDEVRCAAHGMSMIAEGDEGSKRHGRPIALHGHRCACGCTLITSLPHAGRQ